MFLKKGCDGSRESGRRGEEVKGRGGERVKGRDYFVPKIRSPASPSPGTIYPLSLRLSSSPAR
jgi:hypothetical protein